MSGKSAETRPAGRPPLSSDASQLHLELQLEVPRRQVLRYLGYPRGRHPSPQVAATLARLWPQAEALLAPRGAHRMVAAADVEPAAMPGATALVGVGLATIGDALEAEGRRHAERGDALEALVLDAFGSAAAEATADAVNQQVCHAARELQLWARTRISPGYGRWHVMHQAALLALLPTQELCVQLTAGGMMVPRKSVSFAVRLDPAASATTADDEGPRCRRCGRAACIYRDDAQE